MKTPEEIKAGLECCIKACDCDNNCPYMPEINCTLAQRQDALAYIRQLEDQLRDIPKMEPKWISVEERLPEPDEEVLICARSKKTHIHTIAMTSYTLRKYGFNIEGWNEPWQYFNYDWVITHWMPLPEPPKEG